MSAEEVKTAREIAKSLVKDWMQNQLRPEGRAGIYIDDEGCLIYEVEQAITRERQQSAAKIQELEQKLKAAGPRVVSEEEIVDSIKRWKSVLPPAKLKSEFLRVEIEALWPSDKEIMDEARGFPDTARGFPEGVRWLKSRLLGEGK